MQPLTAPPRDDLTADEVVALVEANALDVDFGCELLDADDNVIEDLSADLAAGTIDSDIERAIHRTCNLLLTRELQWGWQRLRPYMTLTDPDNAVTARFNLGVFLLSTPERVTGDDPVTYEVAGYDKLSVLDTPYGSTYSLDAGAGYIAAVEALLDEAGETRYAIDQDSAALTLPAVRQWQLDAESTFLRIINDLLAAIGYRGLWADHEGVLRSEPYVSELTLAPEWTYDADNIWATTVGEVRTLRSDFFDTPNRWVFLRDDPAQDLPVEGDGLYTTFNQSDGPTSIDARGRTITRIYRLEAANQAALVVQGDRIVEDSKRVVVEVDLSVGPNPLHWHRDVVTLTDAELGKDAARFVVTRWSMDLAGGDVAMTMREV